MDNFILPAVSVGPQDVLHVEVVDSWTTWLQVGATVFTALALAIGGIWAFFRFRRARVFKPRCSIQLDCSVATVKHRTALSVNISIVNCGDSNLLFKTYDKGRVEVSPINDHEWSHAPVGEFVKWKVTDIRMRQDFFANAGRRATDTELEPGQDAHRSCLFVMPEDWVAAQVRCLLSLGSGPERREWTATRTVVRPDLTKHEARPHVFDGRSGGR